jgi:hypothetical protein
MVLPSSQLQAYLIDSSTCIKFIWFYSSPTSNLVWSVLAPSLFDLLHPNLFGQQQQPKILHSKQSTYEPAVTVTATISISSQPFQQQQLEVSQQAQIMDAIQQMTNIGVYFSSMSIQGKEPSFYIFYPLLISIIFYKYGSSIWSPILSPDPRRSHIVWFSTKEQSRHYLYGSCSSCGCTDFFYKNISSLPHYINKDSDDFSKRLDTQVSLNYPYMTLN